LAGYLKNVLIGLDQFANTLLGGLPGETISARVGRLQYASRLADWLEDALNFFWPGHTLGAEQHDELRAETVEHTEEKALGQK
jgi:hypothetical protein